MGCIQLSDRKNKGSSYGLIKSGFLDKVFPGQGDRKKKNREEKEGKKESKQKTEIKSWNGYLGAEKKQTCRHTDEQMI